MAESTDNFSDLRELGIDCEDDSLTETFNRAADHLQNLLPDVDNQTLLILYGYYKQASKGPCKTPKPSWFDMKAKSKWESWNKLGIMSKNDAKALYIETIKKLDPGFGATGKGSWVSVSAFQDSQSNLKEADKTIIDYVKEGDFSKVSNILASSATAVDLLNRIDDDGLGLIHWATDRGSVEILEVLLRHGADVNLQDSEGQTALHFAASCGHPECVKFLLSHGARRDVLDNDGLSPLSVANDNAVKELLVDSA